MKKIFLSVFAIVVTALVVFGFYSSRDGELKTPVGQNTVALESGNFEMFPLPDYASKFVGDDYRSYFVEVEPGIKVHMLEVGSGYPVYMQHGVPTSGFLYRKVADQLPKDKFRIIMPTTVGLGFSSKVPASQHSLENHIDWLDAALKKLEIEEAIFVGHDWGGPIGLGVMERSPGLMSGAVILNTTLDKPIENPNRQLPLVIAKTPIAGELLFEGLVSMFSQLPSMQADPDSMGEDVIALYERPVRDSGNSKGVLAMMRMTYDDLDHPSAKQLEKIYDFYRRQKVPFELVWGMNDPILKSRLSDMRANFPDANVTETKGGHFLQEEVPSEIAAAVQRVHDQVTQAKETGK